MVKNNKVNNKTNKLNTQNRFLWADVIRILAIYLVVQVHANAPSGGLFFTHILSLFLTKINIISVPLFVLLSGALLLEKEESYLSFFKKRCVKVLIPWVFWTLVYMFFYLNVQHKQIVDEFFRDQKPLILEWGHYFVRLFLSVLWFLPLIFSLYVLTPFLRIFTKNAKRIDLMYFIVLWFIFLSILPYLFHNPLFPKYEANLIIPPIQYLGYFLMGYLIISKNFLYNISSLPIIGIIALAPLILGLMPFIPQQIRGLTMGFIDPGTVISSLLLFNFFYILCSNYEQKISEKIKKIIRIISGAAFGVYLIHGILVYILRSDFLQLLSPFKLELLLPLVFYVLASLIVVILQRIPFLKRIVP